jgi:cobalt-zinc-cadmium resistance protein CzcA
VDDGAHARGAGRGCRSALAEALPGLGFSFSQPIELRMAELISGTRSDVAITIYGDDLATLERSACRCKASSAAVPGATDVRGEQLAGLPTLEVTVDRAAASRYGISVRDALDAIEALGGRGVGEVYEGERRFRLQVRVPQACATTSTRCATSRSAARAARSCRSARSRASRSSTRRRA